MLDTCRENSYKTIKRESICRGDFTLSSGKKSPHYVNCKPVTLQVRRIVPIQSIGC